MKIYKNSKMLNDLRRSFAIHFFCGILLNSWRLIRLMSVEKIDRDEFN